MSNYVPIAAEERHAMLREVGIDPASLFSHIPEELWLKRQKLDHLAEKGLSEQALLKLFDEAARQNKNLDDYDSYLGAGFYDHVVPAAVHHLINREEFLTSYTPYQQEISQGTLQATFEWQSFICRLSGMDVANASMYDGASACAETALMAIREKRKSNKVWLSAGLNPEYIECVKTYFISHGFEYEIGELNEHGTSAGCYPKEGGYAAFIIQSPNFYGVVENLDELSKAAHDVDALACAAMDPVAMGIFKTPGKAGLDVVFGEAQPLGASLNYGGPALGYMCCTNKLVRKMPGRICGRTVDRDGETSYVLTLQAREQHIRREKATSNICTAQALLATAAAIHMALLGRQGLTEAAWQSADKARYLHDELLKTGLFEEVYDAPYFREFALKAKNGLDLRALNKKLLDKKILGGVVLENNVWLLAATEKKDKAHLDRFVASVKELAGKEEK